MPPYKGKGKGRAQHQYQPENPPVEFAKPPRYPPSAFVQAYEATLIYDQPELAAELETKWDEMPESSRRRGIGLLKWQGEAQDQDDAVVWADRTRNELRSASSSSSSSSSWDSLPSDLEEKFYLSSDGEYEEYERKKRQKWIEALREERLKERAKEDEALAREESGRPTQQGWGDDDEEPPAGILTMMRHTAQSMSKSPNPNMLEMRIMANHAKDERFAFLRGRWKNTWLRTKKEAREAKEADPAFKAKQEKVMGSLMRGYESSDDDETDGIDANEDEEALPPSSPPPPPPPPDDHPQGTQTATSTLQRAGSPSYDLLAPAVEDAARQARRRRVEEWKRKRAENGT